MRDQDQERKHYNNGRRHLPGVKLRARRLRADGWTHREMRDELGISLGTAHVWTIDIVLAEDQKLAIRDRQKRKTVRWSPKQKMQLGKRLAKANKKHSKQGLVKNVQAFYKKHGRIPLKQEFSNHSVYRKYFGSWNKAIIAAGFTPNPVYFAERVAAEDGHICDSVAERIIDDWLSQHGIRHECNKSYPETRLTADFYIPGRDVFIELFGLRGVNRRYDQSYERKMKIVKLHRLKLIAIYLPDVLKQSFEEKLRSKLL